MTAPDPSEEVRALAFTVARGLPRVVRRDDEGRQVFDAEQLAAVLAEAGYRREPPPPEGLRMVAYRAARDWATTNFHQQPDDRMVDASLAAVVRHLEHPDSPLCDCPRFENPPASPDTYARMAHHCDCRAVVAAAIVLGAYSKTEHARQCIHGTEFDEFYAPTVSTGEEVDRDRC